MSYLVLDRISKRFGSFDALNNISLSVGQGTALAVLGENGAGKTTLMNVLFGLYRPTEGTIRIDGKEVSFRSPADAIANGVGMIHQHMHLAEALTVTENIVLGLGGLHSQLNLRRHSARIAALSERYGLAVEPDQPIWKLPIGMRQRVEILKMLYRGAKILVLDEPTSVLAPNEIDSFLDRVKALRDDGTTIIFVTHKLDEVMRVADTVTVMRHGQVVAERHIGQTDMRQLSRLMVGRDVEPVRIPRLTAPGSPVLQCVDLVARGERGLTALDGVSLTIRQGEVLGVAGIDGNGQRELADVICGLRKPVSGSVSAGTAEITGHGVSVRTRGARIGFVPEDRHGTGLVLDHSIATNFALRSFRRRPVSRWGLINTRFVAEQARRMMKRYDVRSRSPGQLARELSGGNQQKIILAREIEAGPEILVVMQATKGLDVGAIEFVQRKILEERDRGVAVLYISTELEHVAEVADRIVVMHRGRFTGEVLPGEATAERIGLLMSGISVGEPQ
ncbi:ABC transporter ATP-binding protein [Mesorhizobium sp. INR15]|uniref:ABC transporter ATP-binding protein n=1 Tax=Mesorhizobium sp. INR15 TaxID=2654248 RepID=UPI0018964BEC|nr:ABC transporter ATP-binding protein [Mesorhizobium sp. INR15]QPC94561.1 ATP-binding cassette domain-containing protein [Mesorhizobium sp. INR15]